MAKRRAQLALILRFGPMTARAYAAVLRVVVTERLWRVANRTHRPLAAGDSAAAAGQAMLPALDGSLNRYQGKGALP